MVNFFYTVMQMVCTFKMIQDTYIWVFPKINISSLINTSKIDYMHAKDTLQTSKVHYEALHGYAINSATANYSINLKCQS